MWVLLLGLFLWGFPGVFLGTITDGPKLTQSMSTLRMYLHEYLSRNLWHLHPYHFSFLSITHTTEVEFLLVSINNHNPVYHWHYPPTRMAVVIALINVIGYNRLVSGGNKTLCKHNREPPYLPATMSIKVKMMGDTLFGKSVNQTFETKWKIRRLLVQQAIVLHFLVFRVTTCKIHIWGPAIIIITSHITNMIKILPFIQHCDHLQSHLFQPSLHWPPCKQGRSWQVWKWRYDVLIISS